jgi:hypothetical protein
MLELYVVDDAPPPRQRLEMRKQGRWRLATESTTSTAMEAPVSTMVEPDMLDTLLDQHDVLPPHKQCLICEANLVSLASPPLERHDQLHQGLFLLSSVHQLLFHFNSAGHG